MSEPAAGPFRSASKLKYWRYAHGMIDLREVICVWGFTNVTTIVFKNATKVDVAANQAQSIISAFEQYLCENQ